MVKREPVAQWAMWVQITHAETFQHKLHINVVTRRHDPITVATWTWSGIGVPSDMLRDVETRMCAILAEHIVTRYGNQLQFEEISWRSGKPQESPPDKG